MTPAPGDWREALPQQGSWRMVDSLEGIDPSLQWIRTRFLARGDAPWCYEHFPGRPVMPGALLLECMAQCALLLAWARLKEEARSDGKMFYLAGVDRARWRVPVEPGSDLRVSARFVAQKAGFGFYDAEVRVNEVLVCGARLQCARR